MKLEGKEPVTLSRPTLIASDVDGTLIDDENRVSEYTKTILANACAAGAEFVLATGRPPRWIAEITDQFDRSRIPVRHAVCANGAILYDVEHDRIISSATLSPEILVELGKIAQAQIPGCGIAAERVVDPRTTPPPRRSWPPRAISTRGSTPTMSRSVTRRSTPNPPSNSSSVPPACRVRRLRNDFPEP